MNSPHQAVALFLAAVVLVDVLFCYQTYQERLHYQWISTKVELEYGARAAKQAWVALGLVVLAAFLGGAEV